MPAVARAVGPLSKALHFLKTGPTLCPAAGTGSIGRIVSSTLVAIVILDFVPFDVGGANDDSTIFASSLSRSTPGSCFLRREN